MLNHPRIIQGGMGAGVSGWKLARAVSTTGHLGVVSGTALDTVLVRRLQLGDIGGHLRRAFERFPRPDIVRRVLADFFVPGGKAEDEPFKGAPIFSLQPPQALVDLTVLANFTEVFLAKEGHGGRVGINLLEKIQLPTLASLFGAMLAGVDYVIVGAGIPRAIPGILDAFAAGKTAQLRLDVEGASPDAEFACTFDPKTFGRESLAGIFRPQFLAVVASATLAMTLARKSSGRVDGFVVEGPSAGGHNAPPRGPLQLSARGEPVYGPRDRPELEKIRALGQPFWLAGSFGRPGRLAEALRAGAAGVQVGTPFAFCAESGIDPGLKRGVLERARAGTARVFTDPAASPTGFPLKIVQAEGTGSERSSEISRSRGCDLGYLRHAYQKPDGTLGYRCPAEPAETYQRKGGGLDETAGKKCVCNGLLATIGLGQIRDGRAERPLMTAGEDVALLAQFLRPGAVSYSAREVIDRVEAPD